MSNAILMSSPQPWTLDGDMESASVEEEFKGTTLFTRKEGASHVTVSAASHCQPKKGKVLHSSFDDALASIAHGRLDSTHPQPQR